MTDFFNIKRGAKQGDKISAILFCLVLASVMSKVNGLVNNGYLIRNKILSYLAYSDDKAMLGENVKDLQEYLDVFVFVNVISVLYSVIANIKAAPLSLQHPCRIKSIGGCNGHCRNG